MTVHAASTVWATFMAGLALGSLGAGVVSDRVLRPLRWFAAVELLIGATALLSPTVLSVLHGAYATVHPMLEQSMGGLTAARGAIAFAALIVPTSLMGATLPIVVRASGFGDRAGDAQLSVLYGSNAIGAIAGTLLAGLLLVPTLGIQGSFLAAAAVNASVAIAAFALSFLPVERTRTAPRADVADGDRPGVAASPLSPRQLQLLLGVFTLSGVVSLALEVVWFRALTLFLRPTVYGFAVMLATVLTGIGVGSYVVTPLLTRRLRWMEILASVQMMAGVAVVLSFGPLVYLGGASRWITPLVARVLPEYLGYPIAGSLLAIFPTALLMGLAFPIGLHLWTTGGPSGGQVARRVSLFYSLNVAGGILGSLAAGFVLLPMLGSQLSLIVLAASTVATGLALIGATDAGVPRRLGFGLAGATAFAVAVWFAPDPFDLFLRDRYPGQQMVWRDEGVEATVVVHERQGELSLTVNGNHEASTGGTMTYVHKRIGHLPMAVHPAAQTVLVIGLGGGATAGAASLHTGAQVDIVELAGSVARGARWFAAINSGVLDKPNVTLRVDDGRNYMLLTQARYDVVTADVILPIWAGAGNLYSAEYFRLMRRVLKPGGLVMQWVAGTEAEYKTIARTFLSVFPHTTVWADGSLLLGSVEPLKLRRRDVEWKLGEEGRAAALRDLGVTSFEGLAAMFLAGPDELRAYVGDGPLLTDDRPLAEYFLSLPRDRYPDLAGLKGNVASVTVP